MEQMDGSCCAPGRGAFAVTAEPVSAVDAVAVPEPAAPATADPA